MWLVDKLRKLRRLRFFVEKPYITRPVGSKFYYKNGGFLRVVKERNCGYCAFFGDTCRCFDNKEKLGECSRLTRTDGVDVIFRWVDRPPINRKIKINMNDNHSYNEQFLIKKLWEFE